MYFNTPKVNRTNYSNVFCGFIRSETIKKFSPILFNTNIEKRLWTSKNLHNFLAKIFLFQSWSYILNEFFSRLFGSVVKYVDAFCIDLTEEAKLFIKQKHS